MTMTPDEMREVGHKVYHEIIQDANVDLVDEVIAADCIDISPNDIPGVGREGTEPLKQFVQMLHGGLSDVRVTIHELLADGNTGIGRITIDGRHTGDFMGIPATNRPVSFDVVDIVKYREGKIREHYGLFDGLGLFQQLGLIPAPGEAPSG
jgi:predicted ester cyclase